jgi:hypothetical protein
MDAFFTYLIEHKKLLKEKEDGTKSIPILKESLDDNEQKWVTIGQNLKNRAKFKLLFTCISDIRLISFDQNLITSWILGN